MHRQTTQACKVITRTYTTREEDCIWEKDYLRWQACVYSLSLLSEQEEMGSDRAWMLPAFSCLPHLAWLLLRHGQVCGFVSSGHMTACRIIEMARLSFWNSSLVHYRVHLPATTANWTSTRHRVVLKSNVSTDISILLEVERVTQNRGHGGRERYT